MTERRALEQGRSVAIHQLGDPAGRTIVLCHAAPGSGGFDPDPDETSRRGARIIAIDRPGYGGSDPVAAGEWATVASAAQDLAEVLRDHGDGPVGVAGWSAGGRVAMALAARHPSLVDRLCVLATPAPHEEVPWIPPGLHAGLEAMRDQSPAVVHDALTAQMAPMIPSEWVSPEAMALVGAGPADEATALDRVGARERIGRMLEAAFAQGAVGMASDVAGYTLRPWEFDPEAVRAKALLLYGAKDPVVGSRHGRWWQAHLPDARLEVHPQAGHLIIVPMWKRALSFLLAGRAG